MSSIKNSLRDSIKKHPRAFGKAILKNNELKFVDVGAANWLPPHLLVLDGLANITLFEPHKESFENLKIKIKNKSNYFDLYDFRNIGLSRNGGKTTLYMLNSPTGSSIMPVDHSKCNPNDKYIYPIKEVIIETDTLAQIFKSNSFDMIKLDVQGSELEILLGAGENNLNNLLCFEMEVAYFDTIYIGAPKPQDVINNMQKFGFELFDLNLCRELAFGTSFKNKFDVPNKYINGKLVETDMLFFKNPNYILEKNDSNISRKYVVSLCVYNMFSQAESFVLNGKNKGIFSDNEAREIISLINKWSKSFEPGFLENISSKISKATKLGMWSKD